MKKLMFLLCSVFTMFVTSCKKDDVAPPAIKFNQPSSASLSAAAGSQIDLNVTLTVQSKIDRLEVFQKIGNNAPTLIVGKGFSNSTNSDVYLDTYTVPAGLAKGTIVTLTFNLYDKSVVGIYATQAITITVN
jgi:hypothetical protein